MDTRETLIAEATQLIQKSGYAGFSYADLSKVVGFTKASIHYHFPVKGDLGVSIVDAYREAFRAQLAQVRATKRTATLRLTSYAALYRAGIVAGRGCLCGVLAAEYAILPKEVQLAVNAFFEENVAWLEDVLTEGQRAGQVGTSLGIPDLARMLLSTLQGAMVTSRPLANPSASFDAVVQAVLGTIHR